MNEAIMKMLRDSGLSYWRLADLRDHIIDRLDEMAEEEWEDREREWLEDMFDKLEEQQKKADAWEAYVPEGLPKPIEWEKYVSDDFEDWADRMEAEDPNF